MFCCCCFKIVFIHSENASGQRSGGRRKSPAQTPCSVGRPQPTPPDPRILRSQPDPTPTAGVTLTASQGPLISVLMCHFHAVPSLQPERGKALRRAPASYRKGPGFLGSRTQNNQYSGGLTGVGDDSVIPALGTKLRDMYGVPQRQRKTPKNLTTNIKAISCHFLVLLLLLSPAPQCRGFDKAPPERGSKRTSGPRSQGRTGQSTADRRTDAHTSHPTQGHAHQTHSPHAGMVRRARSLATPLPQTHVGTL